MSLKAKIEAVIYASEEPVTLTQLVGLLGEEAQAELDREAADQRALLQEEELEAAEAEPTLGPDFDSVGGDPGTDGATLTDDTVVQPTAEESRCGAPGFDGVNPRKTVRLPWMGHPMLWPRMRPRRRRRRRGWRGCGLTSARCWTG